MERWVKDIYYYVFDNIKIKKLYLHIGPISNEWMIIEGKNKQLSGGIKVQEWINNKNK